MYAYISACKLFEVHGIKEKLNCTEMQNKLAYHTVEGIPLPRQKMHYFAMLRKLILKNAGSAPLTGSTPKFMVLPWPMTHLSTKFSANRFSPFCVIMLTNKQNQQIDMSENITSLAEGTS